MNTDIQSAIDNENLEELKNSLNLNTIITPKIYQNIIKNDLISIMKIFKDNNSDLFMDVLSFLSFEGELEKFSNIIEHFEIKDISYNEYECFRRAVSGESEELTLYLLDNFFIKVFVKNSEALHECIIEENLDLFTLIFQHKKCILSNQDLTQLANFCWINNKDFAHVVLSDPRFKKIINSPLKIKVNKEIINVYDSFIKISNF